MGIRLVPDQPDAEVLQRCRAGEESAQREVFERYKDRVFSIAVEYLRGDESAAKDVTQEVFVKAFRGVRTFREDARFTTWLYRLVTNACVDELRRHRRLVFMGDVPQHLHPATHQSEPAEFDREVKTALARLSPKLRMVILLRYFEDLSYDEIAEVLGVTSGTVASRLNRAHRALGRSLAHLKPLLQS
jgi:RNA polymerase sigma-70 factor, ECF subfamily